MNKNQIYIVVAILIVLGGGLYFLLSQQKSAPSSVVTNFAECERAGYAVGESYPRQCWTLDGQSFVEEITIEFVKDKYTEELMAINGVVGVGIGECAGNSCLKVFLENDAADLLRQLPTTLEGFGVVTEVTGPIETLSPPEAVTVLGEMTCLPKIGTGPQTLECALGLRGDGGRYYGLKNLERTGYVFSEPDLRFEVSGVLSSEEMFGPDGNRYDTVGVIDVTAIREIRN